MQLLKGLAASVVVGVPLAAFFAIWLHATTPFVVLLVGSMGLAITAVVGTRSDEADAAADAAWEREAPDLPPASDRRSLESLQGDIPGPESRRPAGAAPRTGSARR